jgi:serine/threonine protein phosphatase 1
MGWGGAETLKSYGLSLSQAPQLFYLEGLCRELKSRLPASHLLFLENLLHCFRAGDYYFVHAGVRPGVPLDRQELGDQLWIREVFTQSRQAHGAVVVHGHSITRQVELLPNRIGIDTGAFYSGVLTALVLEEQSQRLLQTGQAAAA